MSCLGAEDEYYSTFLSLVDTNRITVVYIEAPQLTDSKNIGVKLTNTVVKVDQLKARGEVGDICLGMTMGEVVAKLGKPPRMGWRRFEGAWMRFNGPGPDNIPREMRPQFADGVELYFSGNVLAAILTGGQLPFDHGLCGRDDGMEFQKWVDDWIGVLGQPTSKRERYEGMRNGNVVHGPFAEFHYETAQAKLRVWFPKRDELSICTYLPWYHFFLNEPAGDRASTPQPK